MNRIINLEYIRKCLEENPKQNFISILGNPGDDIQLISETLAQEFIQETSITPLLITPAAIENIDSETLNNAEAIILVPSSLEDFKSIEETESLPKNDFNVTRMLSGLSHTRTCEAAHTVACNGTLVIMIQTHYYSGVGNSIIHCEFGTKSLFLLGQTIVFSKESKEVIKRNKDIIVSPEIDERRNRIIEKVMKSLHLTVADN